MTATSTAARPKLACEVAADRVIAARAADQQALVELYTSRALPPGSVLPGLGGANVADGNALRQAISGALAAVSGRSRDVIAVLPDAAVRVLLLDFDNLPEKEQDAAGLVRFRLKKSLPFDVDRAALSYHAHRANGGYRVVAAISPHTVIEEYEAAFRDAGYSPGVVLPSMLAALGSVDASRPTLVVKVDPGTVSVAIVDGEELRLLRTLENPSGAAVSGAQIAAEVYPSVVFFEDTYGSRIERVLVAGLLSLAELAPALESQTGVRVGELVTPRQVGASLAGDSVPPSLLAGVVGALAG